MSILSKPAKFSAAIVLLLLISTGLYGQNEAQTLEFILRNAEKQAIAYQAGFKDLIAKETKTFQTFRRNGELRKQKIIESNFLVFQSARDADLVTEFRDVTKVNGKPVENKRKTPEEFFEKVEKVASIDDELRRIQAESSRFDDTLEINGLTLFQGLILSAHLRPFFEFKIEKEEAIGGNEILVISYRQIKPTKFITSDAKVARSNDLSFYFEVPAAFRKKDLFLNGTLRIDAKTFQLVGEERELFIVSDQKSRIARMEFNYQPSDYGFLVPKKIVLIQYQTNGGEYAEDSKQIQVTFEYSKFTKTRVEVKILDDEPAEI